MGLKPEEALRLTPAEMEAVIEGFTEKEKMTWNKVVWATVNIMNMFLERPIQTQEVLDQMFGEPEISAEELQKERELLKPFLEALFKKQMNN